MDRFELPYPIRQRQNGWEVVLMDGNSFWRYVLCDTREEAESVADARPLYYLAMCGRRAERKRVQRCLEALHRHGVTAYDLLVRRVMSLAS